MKAGMQVGGRYHWEIQGTDGTVRAWGTFHNGIPTTALNDILDTYFRNGSPSATWHALLIGSDSFTALAATDTMSSHSGWTENTDYDEATRPQWDPPAASGGTLNNTTSMEFTMNAVVTIVGIGISTSSTKSGSSGVLFSTGLFDQEQTLAIGEVLRVYYELNAREG